MEDLRHGLVVATRNAGKLAELRALLGDLPFEVRGVDDALPDAPAVVEDGATFAENAAKKARAVARDTMMLSLADDSGLEVDALGGRPGVRSARFAREGATDAANNAALVAALREREPGTARFPASFRCVLALVDPFTRGGEVRTVEGVCRGVIVLEPRGAHGFGYDPLFVPEGGDRTMAELDAAEKNRVSHRARAFAALRGALDSVLADRRDQLARLR